EYSNRKDLFDKNQRLSIVHELSKKYWYFHPQLEFLEVFWERGGFDLITGNPPWVEIIFDVKGLVSTIKPEVLIRKVSTNEAFEISERLKLDSEIFKKIIEDEMIEVESIQSFIGSTQNYPLISGQKNNLYKNILEN